MAREFLDEARMLRLRRLRASERGGAADEKAVHGRVVCLWCIRAVSTPWPVAGGEFRGRCRRPLPPAPVGEAGWVQVAHRQLPSWYQTLDRLLEAKAGVEQELYLQLPDLFVGKPGTS